MASAAPKIPEGGQPIELKNGRLSVPDRPILPFIEGDGTGPDIWRASQRVFDAAVNKAYGGKKKIVCFVEGFFPGEYLKPDDLFLSSVNKAYGGKKKIVWFEVLAGEKSFNKTGNWLPDDTVTAFQDYLV